MSCGERWHQTKLDNSPYWLSYFEYISDRMYLRFHTWTDASSRNWLGALTGMLLVEHTERTCEMVLVYSNVAKARGFGRSKGRAQFPLPCG